MFRGIDHCSSWSLKGPLGYYLSYSFETLKGYDVEVIEDKHLVIHGNIATAAGCLAAVDLMSWGIEKLYDKKIGEEIIASVLPNGQGQECIY